MKAPHNHFQHAIVLIVVLGVLVILVMLGTTFVLLAGIERGSARNYADYVQARLHAQSGIHYAVSQARNMLTPQDLTKLNYYGEDLNANSSMDGGVENQDSDAVLQTDTCPLSRAVRPSLMKDINKDGLVNEADLIEINKKNVGVSEFIPSAYRKEGDYFSVKIEDLSSRIYVNMEDHQYLQNILEYLAEELELDKTVGEKIYKNKPYVALEEVKTKAGLTEAEYKKIKQHITVFGWCDKTVVKPVPLAERIGAPKVNDTIDGWEQLRPKKIEFPRKTPSGGYVGQGDIVGRAPVNINTASKEVIVALIRNLKGTYFREPATSFNRVYPTSWSFGLGKQWAGGTAIQPYTKMGRILETPSIEYDIAQKIADKIIENRNLTPTPEDPTDYRGLFRSWHQFNLFVDNALITILSNQQERDVLKANFNPNTNLNDFNPDHNRLLWVDKTDLTYYTTEFCFYPTGYYHIESLGRVLTADNKILGQAEIKSVVKLFDIYKQTNQSQFLDSSSISPRSAFGPTHKNKSLQIMPEIEEYAPDADYDGYITSATTENSDKSAGATFRAHFASGLNADSGQALIPDANGPYKDRLITGANPGKLYPDGIFSEYKSVPEYPYQPPEWDKIMVSVWVKPHFRPEDTERIRWYTSWMGRKQGTWHENAAFFGIWGIVNGRVTIGQPQTRFSQINSPSRYPYGTMQDDNGFAAGGMGSNPRKHTTTGSPCLNRLGSRTYSTPPPSAPDYFQAGHWMHFAWVRMDRTVDTFYVNGQTWPYGYDARHLTSGTSLRFSANLRLGQRHDMERYPHPADSTLDEVVVFPVSVGSNPTQTGLSIWNDGRYYQGTDGMFTSKEIDLAKENNSSTTTPITIFLTTWTVYPADTFQPIYPFPGGSNVEVQIGNGNLMQDYRGSVPKDYSGGPLSIDKPVRYNAYFKPQIDLNKIVIDSLILDDVMLYYYSEPKMLSWNYVR